MKIDPEHPMHMHLWKAHWMPALHDEENESRGRDFWQRVMKAVASGAPPHRNHLARGIARYGVPAQSNAALYVALRMARVKEPPRGNPGGRRAPRSTRPSDSVLRAEYLKELKRLQALKRDSPAEFRKLCRKMKHTTPSGVARKVVADRHLIGSWTVRNAAYSKKSRSNTE